MSVLPLLSLLALVGSGFYAAALDIPDGVEVQSGLLDYVVCIDGSVLNVRDESLNHVLFTVPRHASIKPVQSFGVDRLTKTIDGVPYIFTKAEFPGQRIGWVAERYVMTRQECAGTAPTMEPNVPPPVVSTEWTFPTVLRPGVSYREGMRRFSAARSGGRLHAACDLYRVINEQVVAISSGKVIRDKYYFYEGTYALEIKHSDGKVARYGEITGKNAPGVSTNQSVSTGQIIGYIGKVNSGCCTPMLHFELYTGALTGALSQSGNSYQRRKDLMDPTNLLMNWEKEKFGQSH